MCVWTSDTLAGMQSLNGRKGQVSHAYMNVKALNSAATGRLESCHCNALHLPTSPAVQEQGLLGSQAKTAHCLVAPCVGKDLSLPAQDSIYLFLFNRYELQLHTASPKAWENTHFPASEWRRHIKSNCTGERIQICADPNTAFSKSSENATQKEYLYLKL